MLAPSLAIVAGIALLVFAAGRFVDGASATARHFGLPSLLIGIVILGFGTSAPEMTVSALAAIQGNSGMALGNAYGSNIANIALILGLTTLIQPIIVDSSVLRKELPILTAVTALAALQLVDGQLSRLDGLVLLACFAVLLVWAVRQGLRRDGDTLGSEVEHEFEVHRISLRKSVFWMIFGLGLLIASSRIVVWGAVQLAHEFGVNELIIGLTILAVGTSLPELATSIVAARKGENSLALGNVLGSNLFNTLAVVGVAGVLQPMSVAREILTRDFPVMGGLTLALFAVGYGFRREGRINRYEGAGLLISYLCYGFILAEDAIR